MQCILFTGGSEKSSRDIEINSESDDIEEKPEDDIESLVDSYIESDSYEVEKKEGSAEYEDDMNHDYQGGVSFQHPDTLYRHPLYS